MAEYMDYQDHGDQPKTKTGRIAGRIVCILSALWLIFLVVWVFVRSPENVRTDFDPVQSEQHSVSQPPAQTDNPFLKLKEGLDAGNAYTLNDAFRTAFPDIVNLITKSSTELSKNQIYTYDHGASLTLALPYVATKTEQNEDTGSVQGVIGLDVLILPYETGDGSLQIDTPIRYSAQYDTSDPDQPYLLTLREFSAERFRLNFYTLSVQFSGAVAQTLDYTASLSIPLTKDEAERNKIANNITISGEPAQITGGNQTSDTVINGRFSLNSGAQTIQIEYNDLFYRKFSSIHLTPQRPDTDFVIIINGRE